jgi:23S rRNA pseudouridine1911/1915/1917 synthase
MPDRRELPVPEGLDGLRVDAALSRMFGLSRTTAAELASSGAVLVDGIARGKGDRIAAGDLLTVDLPDPVRDVERVPAPVEGLTVLHHDDDIVVVDKPPGVAVHASPGWIGPTVVDGLAATGVRLADVGPAERLGVVHRLDAYTSGVMVLATSTLGYSVLKDAFRERTVDKGYLALVQGHLDPLRGTIDAPIDRHPVADYRFAVVASGRPSVTHYDTREAFRSVSLVDVHLETGRTHQIRVHFSALRHPCVGDITYGADPTLAARLNVTRQWLHAARLGFTHPRTEQWVEFASPVAPDLADSLARLADDQ